VAKKLWQALRNYGIRKELVVLLEDLYSKSVSAVWVDGEMTEWFRVTVGVWQGCNLSPCICVYNLLLEAMMSVAWKTVDTGVSQNGQAVNNRRFADDIHLIAESPEELQELTNEVHINSKRFGLKINVQKLKRWLLANGMSSYTDNIEWGRVGASKRVCALGRVGNRRWTSNKKHQTQDRSGIGCFW